MKKILMGATALAMVGASGAAAQEWSMNVGGFFTSGVGYVDGASVNTNGGSINQQADVALVANGEIIFNARLVADNGLTFGVRVDVEANRGRNGGAEHIDEHSAFISGSFGEVRVGGTPGAHERMRIFAAGGTTFTTAADEGGLLFDNSASVSPATAFGNTGVNSGKTLKVQYLTPNIAGFQAGISYGNGARGALNNSEALLDDEGENIELGARYRNTFGDVSFELGGGYSNFLNANAGNNVRDSWTIGGNVGFAGFKVGAMYGHTNFRGGAEDRNGYAVGANYNTGPWGFGLQYAQGTGGTVDGDYGVSAGVDYRLAPGVTVGAVAEYSEADVAGNSDAWAFGVLTRFDF
ncbi:MAG: porin [Rubrimonas sp.]